MSDSDCDWFDKDDDELFKDLQKTIKAKQAESKEEHIKEPANTLDTYIKELTLKASSQAKDAGGGKKMNISELRKVVDLSPLDMFLYVQTLDYDFYGQQVHLNDPQDRVIVYTRILACLSRLELPGFHRDIVDKFWHNTMLHERFRLLIAKLFCKSFQDLWKRPEEMQHLLADMELLLTQRATAEAREEYQLQFIKDILGIMERGNCDVAMAKESQKHLSQCLQQFVDKQKFLNESSLDIYPSLEDILIKQNNDYTALLPSANVQDYLARHMMFLKQDFIMPLCFLHPMLNTFLQKFYMKNFVRRTLRLASFSNRFIFLSSLYKILRQFFFAPWSRPIHMIFPIIFF